MSAQTPMDKSRIEIDGITIRYGITSVREVLDAGYTISGFEQIVEEPTLATCNLNRGKKTIATLSFYNLKEKMETDQLANAPIDLVLPQGTSKTARGAGLSRGQAMRNRIVWTGLIHLVAAGLFFCVYAFPALFAWVQNTELLGGGGHMPLGMALLVLPAIIITVLWAGSVVGEKRKAGKKLLLCLWLVLNVAVSLGYLVLIDNAFTHRFF